MKSEQYVEEIKSKTLCKVYPDRPKFWVFFFDHLKKIYLFQQIDGKSVSLT